MPVLLNVRNGACGADHTFLLKGREGNAPVHGPATRSVVAERAVGAQKVAALHAVRRHMIRLLLEVERIQSCRYLQKAALRHADRTRPDAHGRLVDTQFTDIVGPGDGVPLGQYHGVAAGGRRSQRRIWQLGCGLRCQRLDHRGVHSPQVLKEPLHHLVPMTVVVLQGHFGDLIY